MNDVEKELPKRKCMDLEEAYVDEYWSTYRQRIHTLLAWGYAGSRNRVQAKHDEPATRLIALSGATRLRLKMILLFLVEDEQNIFKLFATIEADL